MKIKTCTKCKKTKPITEFSKNNTIKDKLSLICKDCLKKYKQLHIKEIITSRKKHYLKNKEKILKQRKKHYEQNSEKIINQNKKYAQSHKKEKKQYNREYRDSHKKEMKEYIIKYYEEHKKIIKIQKIKYQKKRRKIDPNFKIVCYVRTRMYQALKSNSKNLSTMLLTGCDIEYLMYYLQCKFTKGMNWDNYGKWHVDHIKPCSSFNLSKTSEQKKCFNYINLQPLWAKDNIKKGSKILTEPKNRKEKYHGR